MTSHDGSVDQRERTEIHRMVRRLNGYWYRAGVPRKARRNKSEQLRSVLIEAVNDGRAVRDVVGDDVAAFAAESMEAHRSRPLFDVALQVVAAATLVPGGFALLQPMVAPLFGSHQSRVGLPGGVLAVIMAVVPFFAGWHLIRVRRNRLTTQQAALFGAALVVGFAVSFVVALTRWGGSDAFIVMSPVTARGLVLAGASVQLAASWIKHRRWR